MKRKTMITLALLSALGASTAAWAVDYPLPPANSRLIGQNQYWTVQEGDRNLQAIARHFDTAAMLILEANDTIAPVQPKPGTQVLIPSQMLLPDVPREGRHPRALAGERGDAASGGPGRTEQSPGPLCAASGLR